MRTAVWQIWSSMQTCSDSDFARAVHFLNFHLLSIWERLYFWSQNCHHGCYDYDCWQGALTESDSPSSKNPCSSFVCLRRQTLLTHPLKKHLRLPLWLVRFEGANLQTNSTTWVDCPQIGHSSASFRSSHSHSYFVAFYLRQNLFVEVMKPIAKPTGTKKRSFLHSCHYWACSIRSLCRACRWFTCWYGPIFCHTDWLGATFWPNRSNWPCLTLFVQFASSCA